MTKAKKPSADASVNKQSKISTFFQSKNQSSGSTSSASPLFTTTSNKSKLGLKKKSFSEISSRTKAPSATPAVQNKAISGKPNSDEETAVSERNKNVRNVLQDSCFEENKKRWNEPKGQVSSFLSPSQQKTKAVLSQASSIIASITGFEPPKSENEETDKDSVTCIPETQFNVVPSSPTKPIVRSDHFKTPDMGGLGSDSSDDVIPGTPQESAKQPKKKKSFRSFLTSDSSLTTKNSLYNKLKKNAGPGIKAKPAAIKKPVGRTYEEAMKDKEEDLEFASPATISALTTGLSFGREPMMSPATIDENGTNKSKKKNATSGIIGSLSGVKRSSSKGSSPNPKRTMLKTPPKFSSQSANNKPKKFTKNLSKTFACNVMLKEEKKCAQDSKEKDVHIDGDDDLASVLMNLKEEVSPLVIKKKPHKKVALPVMTAEKEEAMEVEFNIPNHDEPDDALDDLISELRQNLTQPGTTPLKFKTRKDKSILSEGVSPRVVKTGKRQMKSGLENVSLAKITKGDASIDVDHTEKINKSPKDSQAEVAVKSADHMEVENHGSCASMAAFGDRICDVLNTNDSQSCQIPASLEEELQKDFTALSPFKNNNTSAHFNIEKVSPHSLHYGRCRVEEICKEGHDIRLHLISDPGGQARQVLLTGFWADVHVEEGCVVHVIGEFDDSGNITISDNENLLVVHPDLLISGTSVVSGLYCMRRAVLNERFKGYDSKNKHMLYGTIIHSFFQQVVQNRQLDDDALEAAAKSILQENRVLHDMYGQGEDAVSIFTEIKKYIPQLRSWVNKYLPPPVFTFGQTSVQNNDIVISKITDIEENVWSPRYGIKGKIDLTVEVKIHDRQKGIKKKLMPLELKTGRPTQSAEHKGQVTLYSMMSSDRRTDPESGLLLYLKDGSMKTVPAGHPNKRGLVQLRNELAHHLNQTIKAKQGSGLPRPINSHRACSKCPQLINCAAYKRVFEDYELESNHAMTGLERDTLAHLQPEHLAYYKHWIHLMMTELATGGSPKAGHVKDLWCKTGWQREVEGMCLSGMVHTPSPLGDLRTESGLYIQEFHRIDHHPSKLTVKDVGISVGDNLVVSGENQPLIALSMGGVMAIDSECVTLLLDRDLNQTDRDGSLVYRLDKADTYNSMATNMTNLTRLMEDTETSAYLRDIVIEKKTPEFEPTMSKEALVKVKPLFKTLNKPQKTAILKVLMCKDYVLIKGYPGTGKTSTIVTLVQILVLLGRSVLLTSYTHSAVDNILLKLAKQGLNFIRLGRPERIHPEIRPYSAELNTLKLKEVEDLALYYHSSPVVATTCLGVGTHPIFTHRKFDICIVDEASQVLQPACLGPLFVSRKFVLVGDPLQLPPVVQSHEARKQGMDQSLFARLDDTGGTYELNLQYRMNSEIMRLSNELVYSGTLVCGNSMVAEGKLPVQHSNSTQTMPAWLHKVLLMETEVIFLDMDNCRDPAASKVEDVINTQEAEVVTLLSQTFVQVGVTVDEIGVITPYRQQVLLLREKLAGLGVEVNTVDQYQGRDKCCIIVSFVKRKPGKGSGILEDLRRLNVALTRARQKLVLVGSVSALSTYTPLKAVLNILRPEQIFQLPPDFKHCD